MTTSAITDWFVLRAGEQHGPFTDAEMLDAATGGLLEASDHVWRPGLDEWQPAGSHFTLAGRAAESAAVSEAAVVTPAPAAAEPAAPVQATVAENAVAAAAPAGNVIAATDDAVEGGSAPAPMTEATDISPGAKAIDVTAADAATKGEARFPGVARVAEPVSAGPQAAAASTAPAPEHAHPAAAVAAPAEPPAKGAAPQWPMPVSAFLSGPYLQRSDVVLTRKNRDFKSWLIRWATKGSFSHAALVFLVPHQERGFNNSFVIESASGGVDLTNFMDYVNDRRSIVGIKRMTKPWFNDEVQSRVRGRMLNTIKSTYSYATILKLARELLADIAFGMKSRIYGPTRAIQSRQDRALPPPNKFICSGLVQMGFVQTLLDMAGEQRLPPEFLSDIVFREDLRAFLPSDWNEFSGQEQGEIMWEFATGFADLLEAVTPEDLASSPHLDWVYVIKRGMVYPATSDDHVRELLTWKPKKRKA